MKQTIKGKKKIKNGKRVLCSGCDKPIKLKDLGGVKVKNGKERWFHNNIVCSIAAKINNL